MTISLFDASGKMSHDSAYYLRLATNLLRGHGYYVSPGLDGDDGKFFAVWPIGYPTLIAGVQYVTSIPVYWSSKITNFVLLCFLFFFLSVSLRDKYPLFFVSFLSAPILIISASSLSELPFIVFVIIGTISCYKFLLTEHRLWLIPIALAGMAAFLSRYIGLYFVVWLAVIAAVNFLKWKPRIALLLLVPISSTLLFCVMYLIMNKLLSGYPTGQVRAAAVETHSELAIALARALALEINLITRHPGNSSSGKAIYYLGFVLSVGVGVLAFIGWRVQRQVVKGIEIEKRLWVLLLSSAMLYIVCLSVLRWTNNFSIFDSRYLAPWTALFIMSIVSFVHEEAADWKPFKIYWAFIMGLSVLLNAAAYPIQSVRAGNNTIVDHFRMIRENYAYLGPGDALISTNDFVQLVYPELHWYRPHTEAQFLDMVEMNCESGNRRVFTDAGNYLDSLDSSVTHDEVEGYDYIYSRSRNKVLVELRC